MLQVIMWNLICVRYFHDMYVTILLVVSCECRLHDTSPYLSQRIKLSKYRTRIEPIWWKWLDEIPVYPQECFAYYKKPFWPILCQKRIGLPCSTLFTVTVTCLLQIILLSNYLLPTISVLTENHLPFPSAPCWVRHSYLSKGLRLIPYTCGSSRLFWHRCWGVKRSW